MFRLTGYKIHIRYYWESNYRVWRFQTNVEYVITLPKFLKFFIEIPVESSYRSVQLPEVGGCQREVGDISETFRYIDDFGDIDRKAQN